MLLDDPFQHFRRAGMVIDAVGPYQGDRAGVADLQAIGLGAADAARAASTSPDDADPSTATTDGETA